MRIEKKIWVNNVASYLTKSDYIFISSFNKLKVVETTNLRNVLARHAAALHIVKNSILNFAAKKSKLPNIKDILIGPTALVVGVGNATKVAKVLIDFSKESKKIKIKKGLLSGRILSESEVNQLSLLPSLKEIRIKLLIILIRPYEVILYTILYFTKSVLKTLQYKINNNYVQQYK